jgi:3D (Asp-Asp-Asp) domain-containing protein
MKSLSAAGLSTTLGLGVALGVALAVAGCSSTDGTDDATEGSSADALSVTSSFTSKATGYYPSGSALEGGFVDRKGVKLRTLQQLLAGQADYVSVAMDSSAFPYGQHLRIKELEAKYGRAIDFRVVDTGGAFHGRGRSRIDICVANQSASLSPSVNGTVHIDALTAASTAAPAAPPAAPTSTSSSAPPAADPAPPSAPPASPPGEACASDGQCNPGNDGSGLICTGGSCVAGCRTNAQCPGSTQCSAGQCR